MGSSEQDFASDVPGKGGAMHASDEEYLTVAEAADRLRVAPSTIRRWIREGDLPAVRLGRRRVGLKRDDLDRWVTPVRGATDRITNMRGDEYPPVGKRTPEEIQRALEAMDRLEALSKAITASRGGKHFSSSVEILAEQREERTRQLMGQE